MPDYDFVLWNYNKFPRGESQWVDQAFNAGKYAFCADYIRLYALYNYGGIYLDLDVEVIKPFDDLLHSDVILGYETVDNTRLECGVMGAEVNASWLKACLDYYGKRQFRLGDNHFDTTPMPFTVTEILMRCYPSVLCKVKTWEFFTAKSLTTREVIATSNTYCIHHFAGSWNPRGRRLYKRFKEILPVPVRQFLSGAKRRLLGRKSNRDFCNGE